MPQGRGRGRDAVRGWVFLGVAALGLLVPLGACDGESESPAQVVVHLLMPQGTSPLVGTTRLVLTFQMTEASTFVEATPADVGTLTELVYTYTFPQDSATTVLEVSCEDDVHIVRARGRSIPFDIVKGTRQNVGVLVLAPGTWSTAPASMKLAVARTLHGAAIVGDGGLMVAGGTTGTGVTTTQEVFDLNAWAPVLGMPDLPAPRSRFAMIPLNADQTMLIGGVTASSSADLWDGPTRTWSLLPLPVDLPDVWAGPRFADMGDGSAILTGGVDQDGTAISLFVRATATAVDVLSGTPGRNDPTITPVQTPEGLQLLVYGGNDTGAPSGALYDPATGEVDDDGASPLELRLRHSVARIGASRAIIAGGMDDTGTMNLHAWLFDASCYDPAASCAVWSDMGPALTALGGFADAVGVGLDPENEDPRALFVGGVDGSDNPLHDAVIIDARTGIASRFPLRTPRSGAALVWLPTGQLALIGGLDGAGTPLDTMEFLQPPTR